jgi:HPt (histidine-containing phosphotransfer) domain-containing protein
MSKQECHFNLEEADDMFSDSVVDKTLTLFVSEYYQHFKEELETARRNKDITKIKIGVHTLKSTSRYLCCEYFAQKCQKIEDIVAACLGEIEKQFDEYLTCFGWLFDDAKAQYDTRFKDKKEDEVEDISPIPRSKNIAFSIPKINIIDELQTENILKKPDLSGADAIEEKDEDEKSDDGSKKDSLLATNIPKKTKSRFLKSSENVSKMLIGVDSSPEKKFKDNASFYSDIPKGEDVLSKSSITI